MTTESVDHEAALRLIHTGKIQLWDTHSKNADNLRALCARTEPLLGWPFREEIKTRHD